MHRSFNKFVTLYTTCYCSGDLETLKSLYNERDLKKNIFDEVGIVMPSMMVQCNQHT